MKDKALEVSLNGRRLFTVGMENWAFLHASVRGRRFQPEFMEEILFHMSDAEAENFAQESIELRCSVGIPDADNPNHSQGRQYESHPLEVGDSLTIRIVETDAPDEPLPLDNSQQLRAVPG